MPGQEIVREAIKTSWTIDKIAGMILSASLLLQYTAYAAVGDQVQDLLDLSHAGLQDDNTAE